MRNVIGLTGPQGNRGEDVEEYYFYLDATPTHSYLNWICCPRFGVAIPGAGATTPGPWAMFPAVLCSGSSTNLTSSRAYTFPTRWPAITFSMPTGYIQIVNPNCCSPTTTPILSDCLTGPTIVAMSKTPFIAMWSTTNEMSSIRPMKAPRMPPGIAAKSLPRACACYDSAYLQLPWLLPLTTLKLLLISVWPRPRPFILPSNAPMSASIKGRFNVKHWRA